MDTQLVTLVGPRSAVELDLIADLICPWSFLGKRSLERALANLIGAPVRPLRWHGLPLQDVREGQQIAWRDHLAKRLPWGVTPEYAERSLREAGRALGIQFDFDRLRTVPDTREAHRLVKLAGREGRQGDVVDALFSAFFEQGRDIGDVGVLQDVARECGLSADTLAAFADPAEGREEVIAEEKRLRGFGVVGTPNLLINGRILVPGPADVSTYLQALDQALFPELPLREDKRRLH